PTCSARTPCSSTSGATRSSPLIASASPRPTATRIPTSRTGCTNGTDRDRARARAALGRAVGARAGTVQADVHHALRRRVPRVRPGPDALPGWAMAPDPGRALPARTDRAGRPPDHLRARGRRLDRRRDPALLAGRG